MELQPSPLLMACCTALLAACIYLASLKGAGFTDCMASPCYLLACITALLAACSAIRLYLDVLRLYLVWIQNPQRQFPLIKLSLASGSRIS